MSRLRGVLPADGARLAERGAARWKQFGSATGESAVRHARERKEDKATNGVADQATVLVKGVPSNENCKVQKGLMAGSRLGTKDLYINNLSCALTRVYRVIPLWTHRVSLQIEHSHLGITHTDTRSVGCVSQAGAYLQAASRYGGSDKSQQQLQAAQGNT